MKCSVPQRFLIVGIGLIFVGGCSMSRGNLARNSDSAHSVADEFDAGDAAPAQTTSTGSSIAGADAPPSQPGVKPSGGARQKLTGWMKKKDPKRESIPLERTDSAAEKEDDSVADDSGWWKHSDAPMTAEISPGRKSKGSAVDGSNVFDQ